MKIDTCRWWDCFEVKTTVVITVQNSPSDGFCNSPIHRFHFPSESLSRSFSFSHSIWFTYFLSLYLTLQHQSPSILLSSSTERAAVDLISHFSLNVPVQSLMITVTRSRSKDRKISRISPSSGMTSVAIIRTIFCVSPATFAIKNREEERYSKNKKKRSQPDAPFYFAVGASCLYVVLPIALS